MLEACLDDLVLGLNIMCIVLLCAFVLIDNRLYDRVARTFLEHLYCQTELRIRPAEHRFEFVRSSFGFALGGSNVYT